jgi:hypothetical protein
MHDEVFDHFLTVFKGVLVDLGGQHLTSAARIAARRIGPA